MKIILEKQDLEAIDEMLREEFEAGELDAREVEQARSNAVEFFNEGAYDFYMASPAGELELIIATIKEMRR